MVARIRKDDTVIVIAGKDKGRSGRVLKVMPKEERVVVEGLNLMKRHTAPNVTHPNGGYSGYSAVLALSNGDTVGIASEEGSHWLDRFDSDGTLEPSERREIDVHENRAHDDADHGHCDHVERHRAETAHQDEPGGEYQSCRGPHPREKSAEDSGPELQTLRRIQHLDRGGTHGHVGEEHPADPDHIRNHVQK